MIKNMTDTLPQAHGEPDFILFGDKIICEVKEFVNINIPQKVERLVRKINLPMLSFKRDLYNSINQALSKADKQIRGTSKVAIGLSGAYGLVMLKFDTRRFIILVTIRCSRSENDLWFIKC